MVAVICPFCGDLMDATPNSDDIAAWYATHHPHLPVHSVIPSGCADCLRPYTVGESVVVRSDPGNVVYTVTALISSPDNPDLVTLRHPDGPEPTFAKSQIRLYVPEPDQPLPAKKDGYF